MLKLSSSDIKKILMKFGVMTADDTKLLIKNIKSSNPHPATMLFEFTLNNRQMGLLFDNDADDDHTKILSQIKWSFPATVAPNPLTPGVFGIDYEGKAAYLIGADITRMRLDKRLIQIMPELSRSKLQKLIKEGQVKVDGQVLTSPSQMVQTSDIEVKIVETVKEPQNYPILYEDDSIVAIDKPAGVLSHPKQLGDSEWTIDDFAHQHSEIGQFDMAIVHRLDRLTSGVILAAKTPEASEFMRDLFKSRRVNKTYIAIVKGHLKNPQAVIDLPIARSNKLKSKFQVDAKGKSAITEYKVLDQKDDYFLVELKPRTGRTHQLRVHMAHIGAPIVGDLFYRGQPADRMMLHAVEIEFKNTTSKLIQITSPLPEEFKRWMN